MSLSLLFPLARAATLGVGAGQPYATIDDALAVHAAGDVIELQAGDHDLATNVFSLPGPLEIRGQGADVTTLRAALGSTIDVTGGVTLSDVATVGIGLRADPGDLHVRDVVMEDGYLHGEGEVVRLARVDLTDVGAYLDASRRVVLVDSEVRNVHVATANLVLTTSASEGSIHAMNNVFENTQVEFGKLSDPVGEVVLRGNRFCALTVLWVSPDERAVRIVRNTFIDLPWGMVVAGATELAFLGNTVVDAHTVWLDVTEHGVVANNVFVGTDPAGGFVAPGIGVMAVDYNLAFGTVLSSNVLPGPHHVAADPLFVGGASGCDIDTSLQAGSPAIDAGHPRWTDPDGTVSNIGAH